MAAELILYNDIVGKKLYKGLTSLEQFSFASAYQGEAYAIKYFPVTPTGNPLKPWAKVDVSNLSLKVGIGPRDGAEARLVAQDTWTKQVGPDSAGVQGYLYATLDLNTTDLNTEIGSADSYTSYFEIQLAESGVYRCAYQSSITIAPVVIGPTGAASLPSPATQYYTKTEIDQLFVKFLNGSGLTITLTSPDGTRQRILGVRNDGSAQDDSV